jgi:hypothetical protein
MLLDHLIPFRVVAFESICLGAQHGRFWIGPALILVKLISEEPVYP